MKKFYFIITILAVIAVSSTLWAMSSITAGDMEITSRLMTFANNVYVARGGLKAVQKDSTLTADRGIYDRDLELVKAIDNVKVVQPGSVMTSDYLEAYVKEDRILARGNPKLVRIIERESKDEDGEITTKKTRAILTCKEVEGFNKENRFLAKGDVHLIEVPYREGETEEEAKENEENPVSDLKCETLELFSEEDKAIGRNNVEIVTETLRATGDKVIYLSAEDRMIIVGHAHAFQTTKEAKTKAEQVSELYANKIIYYPEEDRTIAVGDVHATVYPKSGGTKKKKKDKKKKKKKKKAKKEIKKEAPDPDKSTIEELPEGLPEGDYLKIPAEGDTIEATSDDEEE
jgi:lipopolysaccharide export system protein LptA